VTNRLQDLYPYQLGQAWCVTERADPQEDLESALIRGLGDTAHRTVVDEMDQPGHGSVIPGIDHDLVDGEHDPPCVP
jgi:hypothetical protein